MEIFDKSQARSVRLAEYFQLYIQYLAPEHRTKTNELIEFLENPLPGQMIVYFGLTYHGKPCGIATLMLYPDAQVGIVDHIAIAPTVRGSGAFFSFCEHIADYLQDENLACNYLFAEIILSDQPVTSGFNAITLIRLTRLVGFRLTNLPYYAPDTSIVSNKEACRAALAVVTQPEKSQLDSQEMIRLLKVIFFDHYWAWHKRTMQPDQFRKYGEAVHNEFARIEDLCRKEGIIKINGMKNFDLGYVLDSGRKPVINVVGALILLAIPAALTIVLAFMQAMWTALAVLLMVFTIFALALVPKFRRPLLRFFQLEQ